jgi:hypothetical protein
MLNKVFRTHYYNQTNPKDNLNQKPTQNQPAKEVPHTRDLLQQPK